MFSLHLHFISLQQKKQAYLKWHFHMMPRPHPETNENQHHRFAQHIGSPRRGVSLQHKKHFFF
jgi:hypothetical protein